MKYPKKNLPICRLYSLFCFIFILQFLSCTENSTSPIPLTDHIGTHKVYEPYDEVQVKSIYPKSQKLRIVSVEYDPILDTNGLYIGYSIDSILSLAYGEHLDKYINNGYMVEMICKDGYRPKFIIKDLMSDDGYVVTGMYGIKQGWPDTIKQKYAPYYLVWEKFKSRDVSMWPYGVIAFKIYDPLIEEKYLFPSKDSVAYVGLELFKKYCFKCHGINGLGGKLGPDFNYPKSITEYWNMDLLYSFVKDPSSFEYTNSMPPVKDITEADIESLVKYLEYIKDYNEFAEYQNRIEMK